MTDLRHHVRVGNHNDPPQRAPPPDHARFMGLTDGTPFADHTDMHRLILAVFLAPGIALAADGPSLVSGEPVDRLVAGGGVVAARVGSRVDLFDAAGWRIGRIGMNDDQAFLSGPDEQTTDRKRADRLFDLLGVAPEDRQTTDAESLLDDQKSLNARRATRTLRVRERAGASPSRPFVASATDGVYVISGGRIVHVAQGLAPVPRATLDRLDIRDFAVANDGLVAILYSDSLLLSGDGGRTFEVVPAPTPGTKRIVLSPTGQTLVRAGSRTIQITRSGQDTIHLQAASAIRDLVLCDDDTLAVLTADALQLVPLNESGQPPPTQPLAPLSASRVICAPPNASTPWLLVNPHIISVSEGNRSLHSFHGVAGVRVADAAWTNGASSDSLWLATDAGLLLVPSVATLDDPSIAQQIQPAQSSVFGPPHSPGVFAGFLPRVVVQASATGIPGARDYRGLVYANFPLGLPPTRAPVPARHRPSLAFAHTEASAAALAPLDGTCLREARRQAVALSLAEPDRARSYVRRAAHAAWLPELLVRVDRRLGRRESVDVGPTSTAASDLGLDTANDVRYEARATWDLARLVFSPEEISAQSQALRMADMRRDIESQIDRLFFERRRLLAAAATEKGSASDLRQIRREELEAGLDSLSDGAFSRCIITPPPPSQ